MNKFQLAFLLITPIYIWILIEQMKTFLYFIRSGTVYDNGETVKAAFIAFITICLLLIIPLTFCKYIEYINKDMIYTKTVQQGIAPYKK